MRAGIVRAEGAVVTSVAATDRILIQQKQTSGQYLPREIAYSNFISGGGTGLGNNAVVFTSGSGDLDSDATNFSYVGSSTNLLTVKNLSVGASGLVGSISLFSGTASKGKWLFTPVDNTGNTTMTLTNAAQGGAYTYTIPNVGASANFVFQTSGTGTEAANAVTVNALSGVITTSALTTAAAGSYVITLTNSFVATSAARILITRAGGTNTRRNFQIDAVSGSGTATITIYNTEPTNALNGTVIFNFFVLP